MSWRGWAGIGAIAGVIAVYLAFAEGIGWYPFLNKNSGSTLVSQILQAIQTPTPAPTSSVTPAPTETPTPTPDLQATIATIVAATVAALPPPTPMTTPTPILPAETPEPTATPTQAPTPTPEDTPQLIRQYKAQLDGDQVIPKRTTNTTGEATFQIRDETYLDFTFNLVNVKNVVEADIRCAPAGEIGSFGFTLFEPIDSRGGAGESFVTEGTITEIDPTNGCAWVDMAAVVEAMQTGRAYVTVYGDFPGGEIRGQIGPEGTSGNVASFF